MFSALLETKAIFVTFKSDKMLAVDLDSANRDEIVYSITKSAVLY